MSILDLLRRSTARLHRRRNDGDEPVDAEKDLGDDQALNSSHFDDVNYEPPQ